MQKLSNNSVIVIDNASFHKSSHLKTTIEKDRHIFEYLPPYYHDLNLIEKNAFKLNQAE
ncbi:transposase [Orientia tsutsugamushi]|uniref:transposase n=1 Tax=Orientia tsutsugamushi TaxID=784 RepID=UPI0011BA5E79